MEINFQLKDRTVLIVGPFSNTIQSIVKSLTDLGSDCILIDSRDSLAAKFCQQISDLREVNPKNGRAAFVKADVQSASQAKDLVGRCSQIFGGIDILIDANFEQGPTPFSSVEKAEVTQRLSRELNASLLVTQYALEFFKNRKRGRVLYLMNEGHLNASVSDSLAIAFRTGLIEMAKSLGKALKDFNVTVNTMNLGLTEEYLLAHYTEAGTIKDALEHHRKIYPEAKLSDPEKVSQAVVFLVGSMGAVFSGQCLR